METVTRRIGTLCVLILLTLGCGRGRFAGEVGGAKDNTLRYALTANPTTLDPAVVTDLITGELLRNVYEGLVAWGPDNRLQPNLAASWEIKDGGRRYVFHLRNALFHSGRALAADDVKYSLERACDTRRPDKASMAESYLSDISGVRERIAGSSKEIAGVRVLDAHTVSVELTQPRAYFLWKLTYPCAFVVDREVAPMDREIKDGDAGSGPFRLTGYVPDSQVTLAAFDGFHGSRPKVDRIERLLIKDAASRMNKFRNGGLDFIDLTPADVTAVRADPKLSAGLRRSVNADTVYLGLNGAAFPPFRDARIRRAFALAIDRGKIADVYLGGVYPSAGSILPPGIAGHRELAANPDLAEAKRLLSEAGFHDGKGFPKVSLSYRVDAPDYRIVADAIAGQLKEQLGLEVRATPTDWHALLHDEHSGKLGFALVDWSADYLDPQNYLSQLLTSSSSSNYFKYQNPDFDRLCARADEMPEGDARLRVYQRAEDIALKEAPMIPLYYTAGLTLVSPRVSGLAECAMGRLPMNGVRLNSRP